MLALVASTGCKDGKESAETAGPRLPAPGEPMTWERAEKIARAHTPSTAPYERNPRVKYLFEVAHQHILVHDGEVVSGRGVSALSRYLAAVPQPERRAMLADDLVVLMREFGAFPPIQDREPLAYIHGHQADVSPDNLQPRLEWNGDRGAFRVYYDVTEHAYEKEDPDLRDIAEWTLAIAPDGTVVWTGRAIKYHLGRDQFVPPPR